jgi:cobalt-zinc-cadmium efflux system protein
MSHNHFHNHHHGSDNIKTAFFLNFTFTIIEFIGGYMTNSVAIMTDAVHDLGDSFSIGMSWYLEKYSKKKSTADFSYGYTRFSLLAALINVIVLLIGSFIVVKESIERLANPQEVNPEGMFLLSVLGIMVNGAAVYKMKNGNSLNEKVLRLHLLEDVLGWVAILIGSVILYFKDIPVLDPILSLSIAAYIIYGALKNLKITFSIFLQGVPESINIEAIKSNIETQANIINIHDIHVWSLDGDYHVLSAHILIDKNTSNQEVIDLKKKIHQLLSVEKIPHATLEIEYEGEQCNTK